ncbi:uncharacterized protein LOC131225485 [Magnolia sinica]|uniref:uncharacterized protein LOC131225485 n=1 Tax=Magnolia sinica TaxID=86752 RepID=UPI002658F1F3|nr:uncharacterized protein LOC131225485 [Magnolia sinica]
MGLGPTASTLWGTRNTIAELRRETDELRRHMNERVEQLVEERIKEQMAKHLEQMEQRMTERIMEQMEQRMTERITEQIMARMRDTMNSLAATDQTSGNTAFAFGNIFMQFSVFWSFGKELGAHASFSGIAVSNMDVLLLIALPLRVTVRNSDKIPAKQSKPALQVLSTGDSPLTSKSKATSARASSAAKCSRPVACKVKTWSGKLGPLFPPDGKSIVVVESVAKASVIQKYLGDIFEVLPSYGHVRDLAGRSGSIRPDDDFSMVWEVPTAAWTHLKSIKVALKGAKNLILASDPDREGEAIAWHISEMLQQQDALNEGITIARVIFHEITESSIKSCESQRLSRSSSHLEFGASDGIEDEYSDEFTLLRFENEGHEESYKKLRNRERRHEYQHDYAEEYGPTTEHGDVMLQQRLLMVNWIIEKRESQSTSGRIGWPIWWTTNWSLDIIHCRSLRDAVVAHGKRWY